MTQTCNDTLRSQLINYLFRQVSLYEALYNCQPFGITLQNTGLLPNLDKGLHYTQNLSAGVYPDLFSKGEGSISQNSINNGLTYLYFAIWKTGVGWEYPCKDCIYII